MSSSRKLILSQHMFGIGGIDRVSVYLANGFARAGFDTEMLVFARGGLSEAILMPQVDSIVRVTFLGERGLARPLDLIRLFPAFVRRLKDARPDAIVSTSNNMNWITCLGRWQAGLHESRVLLKTTNPIVRARERGLARAFRKFAYSLAFRHADGVWTLSEAERAELARHFPESAERMHVVANPYVTPAMLAVGRGERSLAALRQVVAIGRFAPQKRLDLLIRACALLGREEAHLTLVGDGPERAKLTRLIGELGLEGRVTLTGFVGDVTPYLARSDLLVLPSVYEGLPAVVMEALAANCPVLATDCFPCARELLTPVAGCAIIEHAEPLALASQIRACLGVQHSGAIAHAAMPYTIEAGAASHVAALKKVLQGG